MQNLDEIIKIAESVAVPMGLTVVDARIGQQSRRRTLELTIRRAGGRISLDDCEEMSRSLEKLLDEQDPPLIDGSYMLEVQSPGLDRQLHTEREFEIFSGEEVEVKTKHSLPLLGDSFTGKLQSLREGVLTILKPQPVRDKSSVRKKSAAASPPVELPELLSLEMSNVSKVCLHPSNYDSSTGSSQSG